MLNRAVILIAEDEPFIALELELAIEDANGECVGPATSVAEALALIGTRPIAGAILDVNLTDGEITPVATELLSLGLPVILQSGVGLPPELAERFPHVVFFTKPCPAETLVNELAKLLAQ